MGLFESIAAGPVACLNGVSLRTGLLISGGAKSPKFAVSCRAYAAARGVRKSNVCKILYFMCRIHCGFVLGCLKGILSCTSFPVLLAAVIAE